MKQMWEVYGYLLFMNSTYNLVDRGNSLNWKGYSILMVNRMRSTEIGCFFVVNNKTMELLTPIFEFLTSGNDFEKCESFMTDKDTKKIN